MTFLRKCKSTAIAVFATLLVVSGLLAGCGKTERSLIETVPSNARTVMTINFDKILKNAGCRFNDGNITLSSDLMAIRNTLDNRTAEIADMIVATAPAIDITKIIAFVTSDNDAIVTFAITNRDLFNDVIMSTESEHSEHDGLTVYEFKNHVVVNNGSQGWIAKDIEDVTGALEEAVKKHFGIYSGIINYIDRPESSLSVAIKTPAIVSDKNNKTKTDENNWTCATTSLSDNLLGIEIAAMDADGRRAEFTPYISVLDTDFLRYIPNNTQAAMAIGQIKDIDRLYQIISPVLPRDLRKQVASILPYIKAVDGTSAIAVNPVAGAGYLTDISPETWDFTVMAHMPQSSIESLSSLIKMYASASGIKTTTDGQQSTISLNGMDINYGNFDGYFMASTRDISSENNNSFTQAFSGKLAAAVIDIPYNSETMKAFHLPYGVYFTVSVEDTAIRIKFRFNGSSDPILTTIASITANNITSHEVNEIVAVVDETASDDIIPEILEPVEETR